MGGYILWTSNKSAKAFADTRVELFSPEMIVFSVTAPENLIKNLGKVEKYGSDYILIDPTHIVRDIDSLIKANFVNKLDDGDRYCLLEINKEQVRKVYGG